MKQACCDEGRNVSYHLEELLRFEVNCNKMVRWKKQVLFRQKAVLNKPEKENNKENFSEEYWIQLSENPYFFFENNPVQCGLQSLKILMMATAEYMHSPNCYSAIVMGAHLYNALRQLGFLKEEWPEMDRLIKANISRIFQGNLPTTEETIRSRFLILLKQSPTQIASGSCKLTLGSKGRLVLPKISEYLLRYFQRSEFNVWDADTFLYVSDHLWKKSHLNEKDGETRMDYLKHLEENVSGLVNVVDNNFANVCKLSDKAISSIGLRLRRQNDNSLPSPELSKGMMKINLATIAPLLLNTETKTPFTRKESLEIAAKILRIGIETHPNDKDIPPLEVELPAWRQVWVDRLVKIYK